MTATVFITGASQGSGRATAQLFAEKGYNVVLIARQSDRLQAVAAELAGSNGQSLAIPTDVSDATQVQTAIAKAWETFSNIDVLVNNAGICLTGTTENTSLEDWHRLMDVNFWGYVHTIDALLPHFLERGTGSIINVGSFGGKMPLPNMTAYCASKYAVTGLTETLHLELEPKGIHVGAVHPGVINSNFMERAVFRSTDENNASEAQERMNAILRSPWVSQPEDIAQAVWQAYQQKRSEVVVGAAFWLTEAYRLFPPLVRGFLGQAR